MGKKAWETTIESLEAQLKSSRRDHAIQVQELHRSLETAKMVQPLEMKVLLAQYPALEEMIRQLWWCLRAGDALKSKNPNIDSPKVTVKGHEARIEGASTRRYRLMQDRWNGKIERWANQLASELDGTDSRPETPRCWKRACRMYGRRQDIDAKRCKECGEELAVAA